MEDDFLTATETAALLRRPEATLKFWRHVSSGPAYIKAGRRVLYRRSDVLSWLEAGRHEPSSAA